MFRDGGQLRPFACSHPPCASHDWIPSQPWGRKVWSTWTVRVARRSMARLVATGQLAIHLGNMWQSWWSAKPTWDLTCLKDRPERGVFSQISPLWVSRAASWQWMFGSFSTRSHLSPSWRKWMHLGVIYSAQSIPYPVRVACLFNGNFALICECRVSIFFLSVYSGKGSNKWFGLLHLKNLTRGISMYRVIKSSSLGAYGARAWLW